MLLCISLIDLVNATANVKQEHANQEIVV